MHFNDHIFALDYVVVKTPTLLSSHVKSRKRANIRNRYNQAPHLTQDTNGKVTTSQLDITNENQEVSPFPAGDQRHQQTDLHESITKQDRNNINDPQKKRRLGKVSKHINVFTGGLKPV